MAWNKPTSNTVGATSSSRSSGRGKMPRLRKGLIAGAAVVVALGALCLWMFSGEEAQQDAASTKERGRIKEVAPAAAPTNTVSVKSKRNKEQIRNHLIKKIEEKYGTNVPANLKAPLHYLKNPPQQYFVRRNPHEYLSHSSERDIASVLMAEPGAFFVIQPEFGESFNQDFINAMLDKIEIKDDDPEEIRKVKQFVTDAKKEIATLVKTEGKKPSELMNEHAAMMFELGRFQNDLEDELNRVRNNPDLSDDDVKDFFAAANKLRQERGLPERPVPNLTRRGLLLQKRTLRAERKAVREGKTKDKSKSDLK